VLKSLLGFKSSKAFNLPPSFFFLISYPLAVMNRQFIRLVNSNFQFFALNAATACSKAPGRPRLIRSQILGDEANAANSGPSRR
jgi:hypothetical protein